MAENFLPVVYKGSVVIKYKVIKTKNLLKKVKTSSVKQKKQCLCFGFHNQLVNKRKFT